uniref:HSF_DOMAIN domain-containing protein n=1 Tax=Angiostrongylus cantonensis TaxID=6313 RepID=A0A0K0DLG8_ANGCA
MATISFTSLSLEWRELVCKSKDDRSLKDASKGELPLKETEDDPNARIVPVDETTNGQPRHYSKILCPGATTAYLPFFRTCFLHYTYRIKRQRENFFMWRDGKFFKCERVVERTMLRVSRFTQLRDGI